MSSVIGLPNALFCFGAGLLCPASRTEGIPMESALSLKDSKNSSSEFSGGPLAILRLGGASAVTFVRLALDALAVLGAVLVAVLVDVALDDPAVSKGSLILSPPRSSFSVREPG